jgi:hypothetical protein
VLDSQGAGKGFTLDMGESPTTFHQVISKYHKKEISDKEIYTNVSTSKMTLATIVGIFSEVLVQIWKDFSANSLESAGTSAFKILSRRKVSAYLKDSVIRQTLECVRAGYTPVCPNAVTAMTGGNISDELFRKNYIGSLRQLYATGAAEILFHNHYAALMIFGFLLGERPTIRERVRTVHGFIVSSFLAALTCDICLKNNMLQLDGRPDTHELQGKLGGSMDMKPVSLRRALRTVQVGFLIQLLFVLLYKAPSHRLSPICDTTEPSSAIYTSRVIHLASFLPPFLPCSHITSHHNASYHVVSRCIITNPNPDPRLSLVELQMLLTSNEPCWSMTSIKALAMESGVQTPWQPRSISKLLHLIFLVFGTADVTRISVKVSDFGLRESSKGLRQYDFYRIQILAVDMGHLDRESTVIATSSTFERQAQGSTISLSGTITHCIGQVWLHACIPLTMFLPQIVSPPNLFPQHFPLALCLPIARPIHCNASPISGAMHYTFRCCG